MEKKNYAEKIKELRGQQGFSQEELAEKSGLSLRTVQRIEKRETEPQGNTLKKLADALGVTPYQITDWEMEDDRQFLKALNLSALAVLINVFLGILLPLILWIAKKHKVKSADEWGKSILNFQITYAIISYIVVKIAAFYILGTITFNINFGFQATALPPFSSYTILYLLIVWGLILYNVIFILKNQRRIQTGQPPRYFPKINFIQ